MKRNLLVFFRRFRKNYQYFLKTYSGKNSNLLVDQFIQDNINLSKVLFGNEGARLFRIYIKKNILFT